MIESTIRCPLPGLEAVEVTYNLMATGEHMDRFIASMGDEHSEDVIMGIRNWPTEQFGEHTLGNSAPTAFRIWVSHHGLQRAITEFINAPL